MHFPTSLSFQIHLSLQSHSRLHMQTPAAIFPGQKLRDPRIWLPVPALFGTHACSQRAGGRRTLSRGFLGMEPPPQAERNRVGWTLAGSEVRAPSRPRTGGFRRSPALPQGQAGPWRGFPVSSENPTAWCHRLGAEGVTGARPSFR